MSKQTTASEFDRAYTAGNLAALVPLARRAFAANMFSGALEDEPSSLVEFLLGEEPHPPLPGDLHDFYHRHLFAAIAMGIAMGQLLHPDVFDTGKTR